ncbi:MAG: response regulator [Desulfobacula sp.]|nr:response regulator [Desulfobacula sp.]
MGNNASPVNILVIDDEQDIREGCERILSRMECEVVTAFDGTKGLEILETQDINIVLSDIKMPGISGLEVLSTISERYKSVMVIMITGFSTVETAIEAMKKGAYDFISKPFSPDQLRIVVKRAIEKLRLTREAKALKLEQQKNLADLETEQSRTRAIIENLPNGVLVTNMLDQIVLMNPMAKKYLGLAADTDIGKKILDCIEDKEFCEYIKAVSMGKTDDKIPCELALSHERYIQALGKTITGDDGECLGAVINLSDITAIKIFDRLKSEFVSKVSHELRSPLSVIHEQLAMVMKGDIPEESDDHQYILGRAKDKTKNLISLIGDLLDLSKIESGSTGNEPEKIQLNDFIGKIVDFLNIEAQKKDQILIFNLPEKRLPEVEADPIALESIFGNLIANAIKYTPKKGKIEVTLDTKDNYVRVQVKDSGYGIEERHLSRIFDKFYRIKDDNTRFINGTGLGLAIAKTLINELDGDIFVESKAGKGSLFTVLLPAGINS